MLRRLISFVSANLRPTEIRHWTGTEISPKCSVSSLGHTIFARKTTLLTYLDSYVCLLTVSTSYKIFYDFTLHKYNS